MSYPPFAVTVDVVLFTLEDDTFKILLIERGHDPYRGQPALPGGFVLPQEDLDAAAARELEEETGLADGAWTLEQLAAYGAPARDPRMRTVTVAFWAVTADVPRPQGGSDAASAGLYPVDSIENGDLRLAFDHDHIVADAVERIRSRMETTSIAARFCPQVFTTTQLRRVYERIWKTSLDSGNFHRFMRESGAFVPAPDTDAGAPRHPAQREPGDLAMDTGASLSRVPAMRLHDGSRGRPAVAWQMLDRQSGPLARPLRRKSGSA